MSVIENGDRRRSERFRTINLISYRDSADNGETIETGMARTLDLSENGALIKLQKPLTNPNIAELEMALEDEIICLTGNVIEQFQASDGFWCVRIDFSDLTPFVRHKLSTFIMNLV